MRRFHIVASGYNAGNLAQKCINSLLCQWGDNNWTASLISDGSTDGVTNEILSKVNDQRISVEIYEDNVGATFRRHNAIMNAGLSDHTVIIFLGLDDQLKPHALSRISDEYDKGKWMTWGNWIDQHGLGLPRTFELHFPQWVHDENAYRKVTYRSTAPNTFLFALYKRIPVDRFQIDGKWIDSTTESEVMFSCLEMSGEHRQGIIYDYIYTYNRHANSSLMRLGKEYKYRLLGIITQREPMPRLSEI